MAIPTKFDSLSNEARWLKIGIVGEAVVYLLPFGGMSLVFDNDRVCVLAFRDNNTSMILATVKRVITQVVDAYLYSLF